MNPLVSIVITYYNQTQYIRPAIDSALDQSYSKVEVIVIDDGSTSESAAYLESVKRSSRVIHQANAGVSAARNRGFAESHGAYVIFLDGDDLLKRECVSSHLAALETKPDAGLIFSAQETIDEDGKILVPYYICTPRRSYSATFLECNPIGCPAAAMYARKAVETVGGYDSLMQPAEDYDLSLRVAHRFPVLRHQAVACSYRSHSGGVSKQSDKIYRATMAVLQKAQQNLSLSSSEKIALAWGYRRAKTMFVRPHSLWRSALLSLYQFRTVSQTSVIGFMRERMGNG